MRFWLILPTMRGKMREAEVDLMIQRATRVAAWIPVNKCT